MTGTATLIPKSSLARCQTVLQRWIPGGPTSTSDFDEFYDQVIQEWQEQALCAQTDPEAFFPEKGGFHPRGQAHLPRLRSA
ncbi:hypothetical protein CVAR21S_02389 [Corynebacterium variabile]